MVNTKRELGKEFIYAVKRYYLKFLKEIAKCALLAAVVMTVMGEE